MDGIHGKWLENHGVLDHACKWIPNMVGSIKNRIKGVMVWKQETYKNGTHHFERGGFKGGAFCQQQQSSIKEGIVHLKILGLGEGGFKHQQSRLDSYFSLDKVLFLLL